MAVKSSPKKVAPKIKVSAAPPRKAPAIKKRYTKTEILNEISKNTSVSKKEVAAVLEELGVVIERHIKKRAVGEFTLPGLLKIKSVAHPARPARKNVPNPFRPGETMAVADQPPSRRLKILALKNLQDMS